MVVLWEETERNRKRRGKYEKEMEGVGTTVERITDCLAHFGTMQVEIICLFCSCGVLEIYDILWPVNGSLKFPADPLPP